MGAKSEALASEFDPMTTEQMVAGALINHIDEHVGNISKTVGR